MEFINITNEPLDGDIEFTDCRYAPFTPEDAAIMERVGYGAHEYWDCIMSAIFLDRARKRGISASAAASYKILDAERRGCGAVHHCIY